MSVCNEKASLRKKEGRLCKDTKTQTGGIDKQNKSNPDAKNAASHNFLDSKRLSISICHPEKPAFMCLLLAIVFILAREREKTAIEVKARCAYIFMHLKPIKTLVNYSVRRR